MGGESVRAKQASIRERDDVDHVDRLCGLIKARAATVAVIGLGYVGLPLAVEKGKVGFKVIGIDRNIQRVRKINRGENYIGDVAEHDLKELVRAGLLRASKGFDRLEEADVIVICVPTPLTRNLDPDLSYVVNVTREIARRLRPGQLVTLESTTFPGTTQEVVLPILAGSGLEVGQDYFLAFSPERVDPGNQRFTTRNTSKVVGGVTDRCLQVAQAFYEQTIQRVVTVSTPAVAEMTKVFENTYRAVNIALVNELALLCDRMQIDVWEVLDAASTKPFGIQIFHPGPGVGGHCIPVDPFYLTWKAREYDFHTRFIELAAEINGQMPYYLVDKLIRGLNRQGKAISGCQILLLGVAYKRDVDDVRESPAHKIVELLEREGATVRYHDPYVPSIRWAHRLDCEDWSLPLTEETIGDADCVVIQADHTCIDYDWVARHARLVLDARNATRTVRDRYRDRILRI